MKVLCINTNGLHNDGITNSIFTYYEYIDKSDMKIDLLKTKDTDETIISRAKAIGLNVVFSDYRRNVLRYIIKTAKLIKAESYDIVHVHGSSSILSIDLLAAFLGGCKVRIAHSRNTKCKHNFINLLLKPLFYSLCTARFACGNDAGKWLFGNRSFQIVKNAKNIDAFSYHANVRETIRKQHQWSDKIVIGHVGNFNYQKNHEFLIDVFHEIAKQHPNSILVLIGSGSDYLNSAKEQVRHLGIEDKVIFMGSINNVPDMLQAMDFMLFPSRFEGLPNVVLEWQIAGLPAVISNKITKECALTNLINFASIDDGTEIWCTEVDKVIAYCKLANREKDSEKAKIELRKAGFDIVESSKRLKKMYEDLVRDNR